MDIKLWICLFSLNVICKDVFCSVGIIFVDVFPTMHIKSFEYSVMGILL